MLLIGALNTLLVMAPYASATSQPKGAHQAPNTTQGCRGYTVAWDADRGLQTSPNFPADLADRLRDLYEGKHAARLEFAASQGGTAEVDRRLEAGDENLRRSVWALDRGLRLRDDLRIRRTLREYWQRCAASDDPGDTEADEAMRELWMQDVEPPAVAVHRAKARPSPKRGASQP